MLNSKTTLGDLINSILSDTTIYNTVESLVDTVLDIALVFVWFLFAINMAIIYVKALMNSESLSFSSIKGGLIRALIVVAIMNAYKPFVYTVDGIFMSIYNEMRDGAIIDENGVADYMEKRTNFNGKIESYVGSSEATEEVSFLEKAAEVVTSPSQSIKNSASGVVFSVIHNILSTVLGVIGAIMLLIAWVIIQIFKIIGPLAMLFSVLDIWGGNWMKWFNAYVGSYGAMIVVLLFCKYTVRYCSCRCSG